MLALFFILIIFPIVWLLSFIKAYNSGVFKAEKREKGTIGKWVVTGVIGFAFFVAGALCLSHWADGVQDWEHWSWIVGGAIGFIVFSIIIIMSLKSGFLGSIKEDPRRLWPWTIFGGAALICLIGSVVNLIAIL